MGQQNLSLLTEFILMGVTRQPELQVPLFGVFLIIYTVTVVGNLGMIILTQVDSHIHTPMCFFFIKHLPFIDLGISTVICPKMLVSFVVDQNTISYYAYVTQLAFFLMFFISEFFILSPMAYDCYLAICHPLCYSVIMSRRLCHVLVGILLSYVLILIPIFQMHSAEGRKKAFSTCGSHLTVVVVFCGSLLFTYMEPNSTQSFHTDKTASVFYTLVILMFNPFIYSLRNKEVKSTFYRIFKNQCNLCI